MSAISVVDLIAHEMRSYNGYIIRIKGSEYLKRVNLFHFKYSDPLITEYRAYLLCGVWSFSRALPMSQDPAFIRGGYSLKVARNSPTTFPSGYMR